MNNKDFIKTWFANIDAAKFENLKNMMSNSHSFNNPMTPAPANGDTHLSMMQMMTGAFSGGHILDVVMAEGEWVTARGRWAGKHTGEFNGIGATGKTVEFSWMDMMQVVDGKVEIEYFEMNPMAIMQQIGS